MDKQNKQKTSYFFPILVLAVFMLALIFFAVSVGLESSNGKKNLQNQYNSIVNATKECLNKYGINKNFTEAYAQVIETNQNLAALILLSDGSPIFAYPFSSSLFTVNENGEPELEVNSPSLKMFTSTIEYNNSTILLSVALYPIAPERIFFYARITFIMILCATLLVFVVLIFVYIKYRKAPSPANESSENDFCTDTDSSASEDVTTENTDVETDITTETATKNTEIATDSTIETATDEAASISDVDPTHTDVATTLADTTDSSEVSKERDEVTSINDAGILEEQLEIEIQNCVSNEKDLALFVIQTKNLSVNSEKSQPIIKTLLDEVKSNKLIFEFKDDCYALIKPDSNLDDAMQFVHDLYLNLVKSIQENELQTELAIGISTRSLRLVSASRLINEANLALEKALSQENSVPVVAFRVDLEKYKQSLL